MAGKRVLIALVTLVLTAGGGAMANEIYKWVDDDGNVHYGDRPSGAPAEQQMAINYRRTDPGVVQDQIASQNQATAARQERRAAADEEARLAAEKEAEAADRQKRCEKYRSRLKTMLESRRLYREDESGERVYLDEKQTQDARRQVEDLIAENCSS